MTFLKFRKLVEATYTDIKSDTSHKCLFDPKNETDNDQIDCLCQGSSMLTDSEL